MRIITRIFGLSFIFMLISIILLQMLSFNVRYDEMITCTNSALTSTQIIIQEQIEEELYPHRNIKSRSSIAAYLKNPNHLKKIENNEDYLEEFAAIFYKSISTNTNYEIRAYDIDFKKGFIDIEVIGSFKMFNGQTKMMSVRKSSIIDVVQNT